VWFFPLQSLSNFALFGGVITILIVAVIWYLQNTPLFRQLKCVRDNELGLIASGRNPSYYKLTGILISAAISAIAGSLYAVYFSYIDPSSFTLNESILLLSIVLIGGAGNLIGPITGAIFYVLLPEVLNFISFPDSMAANFRMMIYALILILIIRFKPDGFFGEIKY
jgi:branched-chain amino acid transport system permease protein